MKSIVVYDASSMQLKDASSAVNIIKKFTTELFNGETFVVRGGFSTFSEKFPDQVDERPSVTINNSSASKLSLDPPAAAPIAGGCMIPEKTAANPFFGNIRQNMDLVDGVGQIPVQLPRASQGALLRMPSWLRKVTAENDKGATVANRFLAIEKAEQQRMQKALSSKVSYGATPDPLSPQNGMPDPLSPRNIQIAGIEKGSKNRYKDMLPYDHARVKLTVSPGACDYVNASHIRAQGSNKHYIACQAPIPATFMDFWRLIWQQGAHVIVMLSAELDGGLRKVHPYWIPGCYGHFKLENLHEWRHGLDDVHPNLTASASFPIPPKPDITRRHTGPDISVTTSNASNGHSPASDSSPPHAHVRHMSLQNSADASHSPRQITLVQYTGWPDFGAPAHPAHVLSLVQFCDAANAEYQSHPRQSNQPAAQGENPMVVHCSAGCGRTGTFCTIDSVIDRMKRVGSESASKDADLVADTVSHFRRQRLSMVQTLRQFVLCYETVLEWVVKPEAGGSIALEAGDEDPGRMEVD